MVCHLYPQLAADPPRNSGAHVPVPLHRDARCRRPQQSPTSGRSGGNGFVDPSAPHRRIFRRGHETASLTIACELSRPLTRPSLGRFARMLIAADQHVAFESRTALIPRARGVANVLTDTRGSGARNGFIFESGDNLRLHLAGVSRWVAMHCDKVLNLRADLRRAGIPAADDTRQNKFIKQLRSSARQQRFQSAASRIGDK